MLYLFFKKYLFPSTIYKRWNKTSNKMIMTALDQKMSLMYIYLYIIIHIIYTYKSLTS